MNDESKATVRKLTDLLGVAAWLVAAIVARNAFLAPSTASEPRAVAATVEKTPVSP